jgi:hypothetical protein
VERTVQSLCASFQGYLPPLNLAVIKLSSLKLGKHGKSVFWLSSDSRLGRSQRKIIVGEFSTLNLVPALNFGGDRAHKGSYYESDRYPKFE